MMNGILNLNKPAGKSSHDMVYFARRVYKIKKIGHAGTLDPEATGVLPILIGSATKLTDLLLNHDKKYQAVLKLGIVTDTMDATGKVLKTCEALPDFAQVQEACESFTGEILQVPPMYSAIKVNGRKLYEYARKDIKLELQPRKINIYDLTCGQTDKPDEYILNISCSKGTYIRSICHDIGEKLNCGGIMSGLCRTSSGIFDIAQAYEPEYIENLDKPESVLISCEEILKNFADNKISLDAFYSRLAKNGAEIYLKKLGLNFDTGEKILMYDNENKLFALGEIKNFTEGKACKAQIFI
jgi:tRNA pseudouridine55 synthase